MTNVQFIKKSLDLRDAMHAAQTELNAAIDALHAIDDIFTLAYDMTSQRVDNAHAKVRALRIAILKHYAAD